MSIRHLHLRYGANTQVLRSVMHAVDRHLKAAAAVAALSTAGHAWCRQGSSANQADRDRYENAVNERDTAATNLRAIVEEWKRS